MSKEANNLTSALKGDSQQRGTWGEAQLCRTLEISGLIKDTHYEVQNSFKDRFLNAAVYIKRLFLFVCILVSTIIKNCFICQ